MKNKFVILIKISFLGLLVYYFNKLINTNKFLDILNELNLADIILLLFLYVIFFILITLRWITVIRNFSKINFFYFFKNIILGYNIALFSTSLAVDATKFYGLNKKIGSSKSFALVIYDKFFTLFFKIFFLVIVVNFFNFLKYNFYENLVGLLSFFILIILFFILKNICLILKYLLKFKYLSFLKDVEKVIRINKNIKTKLFINNLVIQLHYIIVYFFTFKIFIKNISLSEVMLLTPIIEIIGQLQTLMIGIIELVTVILYKMINFNSENILAASLTLRFSELLITIPIYLISIYKSGNNR